MMGHREKLVGGAEWDAFSRRARKLHYWAAGEVKAIKKRFHRRIRRLARLALKTSE